MTRKHFELVARVLSRAHKDLVSHDQLARLMADALSRTNPNFDHGRFVRACQPE